MKVTCIIPVKNEEETISDVIQSTLPYCDEVIIVDGGSKDRTVEIAKKFNVKILKDSGKGKGDGMKTGVLHSSGDIIVFIDGDGSHNPGDIPALVKPLKDNLADLVIASRIRGGSDEAFANLENIIRMLGGFFLSFIIKKIWKIELTDCLNGFKAIKKEKFLSLNLTSDDFVIDEEIVLEILKNGGRIVEIPSHEFARKGGKSKLRTIEGWRFLTFLLKSLL